MSEVPELTPHIIVLRLSDGLLWAVAAHCYPSLLSALPVVSISCWGLPREEFRTQFKELSCAHNTTTASDKYEGEFLWDFTVCVWACCHHV